MIFIDFSNFSYHVFRISMSIVNVRITLLMFSSWRRFQGHHTYYAIRIKPYGPTGRARALHLELGAILPQNIICFSLLPVSVVSVPNLACIINKVSLNFKICPWQFFKSFWLKFRFVDDSYVVRIVLQKSPLILLA